MPVFLSCGLCGVRAVDGMLSRFSWGHVQSNPHGILQACPVCREKHADWEQRLIDAAAGKEAPKVADPYGRNWAGAAG
jgi:hypothetical protein